MSIKLLETIVYEGEEYIAIEEPGCGRCAFYARDCSAIKVREPKLNCVNRPAGNTVAWLTLQQTAVARLKDTL